MRVNEFDHLTLLLDTGASRSILKPTVVERLGGALSANAPRWPASLADGKVIFMRFARLRSLRVGDLAVEDLDVGVYDILPDVSRVDGLLGGDFLGHFRVSIDRTEQRLTLEAPGAGTPAETPARAETQPRALEATAAPEAPGRSPMGPEPAPRDTDAAATPLKWKPGYEWRFRWESPLGQGTFVWTVTGEADVEGIPSYVVKSGSREIAFAKGEGTLGWHADKISGVLVERASPPNYYLTWPLFVGKSWEYTYTWESIPARQTDQRTRRCTVEGVESVTVPAGTFETFRVSCTNRRGKVAFAYWFSEAVKMIVKEQNFFEYGVRTRELTGYRHD